MGVTTTGYFVKRKCVLCFLFVTILLDIASGEALKQMNKHTDIVLIGGMGDLSKKYLHHGFYSLITKHSNAFQSFSFYPSGRTSAETTEPVLTEILNAKINCDDAKNEICVKSKNAFLKITKYVKLKSNGDYQHFCSDLKLKWKNSTEGKSDHHIEVIFYLSIPSSGYLSTAEFINRNCRIKHKNWRLKVVMEKPFGHDRHSAHQMGLKLSDSFSEEEIYRVDHYLGKTIAREILNFRKQNEEVEGLLNRNHVEHVEIFMKEMIGVKGRIEFYDETGVIKDVFQNHLTELLTLVAMDIPQHLTSSATKEKKLKLLSQIEPVKMSGTLLGQYSGYMKEAEEEGAQLHMSKFTPTFAATVLNIHSPRWEGVPFVVAGGKKLDERSGYVRVVFKRNTICVKKCEDKSLRQLIFHIGHGEISSPAIVISKSLGQPVWPDGFFANSTKPLPTRVYGQKTDDVLIGFPEEDSDAYTVLIEDLFLGVRDNFVGTDHLLALWDIWSDVATKSSSIVPRIYEDGDADGALSFGFTQNKLKFNTLVNDSVTMATDPEETRQTPSSYLGHKLITSDKQKLGYLLASHIADSIKETLKFAPVYHIAFSGGSSPVILFETIAQHFADIPWRYVHIWQVDERCVPSSDKDSNFLQLETFLLKYIKVPHFNIHPMPVEIAGKLCSSKDNGLRLYKDLIKNHVDNRGFDYVVLGVGSDGHTASIFPYSKAIKETVRLTAFTDKLQGPFKFQRMTLTLRAINDASNVSVFVVGKEKREILKELEEKEGSVEEYPILGVNPDSGLLTWFIDEDALS